MKQIKNPYAIFIKINMGKIYRTCKTVILVKQKQFKCVFHCESNSPPNKYSV